MADGEERVTVSTYVPAGQRDRWREHAERLDMSQSEFVRSMVQAGRRGFGGDGGADDPENPDATPRGDGLETRIVDVLREEGHLEWEGLVEALTDGIESRLEDALAELQRDDRVRYNGRRGGYVLVGDEDGE